MKTIWKVLIGVVLVIIVIALAFFIYMKSTYLSENEIKDIIIEDTKQKSNDIYFESVEFEWDEKAYDVNIYYNNVEYEYKVDAKNGRIVYTDFHGIQTNHVNNQETQNNTSNQNNTNNQNSASNQNGNQNNGISLNEAKDIAFTEAGVTENNVTVTKAVHEIEDGIDVFEIEFVDSTYEYDFTINKNTGEVMAYDKDHLRR